jgi:hypothetical protein
MHIIYETKKKYFIDSLKYSDIDLDGSYPSSGSIELKSQEPC